MVMIAPTAKKGIPSLAMGSTLWIRLFAGSADIMLKTMQYLDVRKKAI